MRFILSVVYRLTFILACLFLNPVQAQPGCHTVNAGNDTTLCNTATIQLHGITNALPGSIKMITWNPSTGISNPSSLTPFLNITSSSQYILTVNALSGNNLLINGDFSLGDSAFSTNYVQGTGGQYGILSNEGEFDISTDPALSHNSFPSFSDHTNGSGNMMVINGASVPTPVWCQTVAVLPNTSYDFSSWMATCYYLNPSILQFSINGNLLGSPFTLTSATGIWQQFSASWFSGTDTVAEICIVNQSTAIGGNDFALDDIFFSEICSVSDTIDIEVISAQAVISGDTLLCHGETELLNVNIINNAAYLWNSGATTSSISVSDSGLYIVTVTVGSACVVTDSVNVVLNSLSFSLDDDTVICAGQSILLTGIPGATNSWSTGDTTTSISASSAGIYTVQIDSAGCTASDSITISFPPFLSLGNDTVICDGHQLQLNYNLTGASYLWNTGNTGTSLITDTSGIYILQAIYNSGCIISDSINVSIVNVQTALDDSLTSCSELFLNAAINSPANYLWSNGSTSPVITVNSGGWYYVTVTADNGCISADSVITTINSLFVSLDTSFIILEPGQSAQVTVLASGTAPFTYQWNPATSLSCAQCPAPVISAPADTTYYSIQVTDGAGCTGIASLIVIRAECEMHVFIPNSFTPNNDGRNDHFTIGVNCPGEFRFDIYNRWGDKVFETDDPLFQWNGKRNGSSSDLPEGAYFYICKMGKIDRRGAITLLR